MTRHLCKSMFHLHLPEPGVARALCYSTHYIIYIYIISHAIVPICAITYYSQSMAGNVLSCLQLQPFMGQGIPKLWHLISHWWSYRRLQYGSTGLILSWFDDVSISTIVWCYGFVFDSCLHTMNPRSMPSIYCSYNINPGEFTWILAIILMACFIWNGQWKYHHNVCGVNLKGMDKVGPHRTTRKHSKAPLTCDTVITRSIFLNMILTTKTS